MKTLRKSLCESKTIRENYTCSKKSSEILDEILREPHYKDYTCIILGQTGPTGKTWLWDQLKSKGINAVEISEGLLGLVGYTDDRNHCLINDFHKTIVIVLNHSLR